MKYQLSSLKNDCSLFSRLYISCETRDGDLDELFSHENQACPSSLSNMGKLRLGTKSDIVSCLERLVPSNESSANVADMPTVNALIFDGATTRILNMLKPRTSLTFADYAVEVFLPYISRQLQRVNRLDLVWDEYIQGSLKSYTQLTRSKGSRRRVEPSNTVFKLKTGWSFSEMMRIKQNCFPFQAWKHQSLTQKARLLLHITKMYFVLTQETQPVLLLVLRKRRTQGFFCMLQTLSTMAIKR